MTVVLMRSALQPLYQAARSAHPGLLLQRGYREHESGNADNLTKTEHIRRICGIPAGPFYTHAYDRWVQATCDDTRFAGTVLRTETRLFIGLSGSGALETGCAIHHSYGVPYIPGSSIKGAVSAFVRSRGFDPRICDELFGAEPDPDVGHPDGLSGLLAFHDAWWVPESARTPLAEEVVTTHHPDYYGQEGAVDATDLDSPVPNAQVAAHGSFLFTLEGPTEWLPLAVSMLERALGEHGIGAKTRTGYGIFVHDEPRIAAWTKRRSDFRETAKRLETQRKQEAQQAAANAAFAALAPEQQALETLSGEFKAYRTSSEHAQSEGRAAFIGQLNRLAEAAATWSSSEDRAAAVELLTEIYDAIGWGDPGQKKDKRAKQEKKRRARLDALRDASS